MKSLQTQIAARMAELMPSYLVTSTGDFAGVHDLAEFQKSFRATISSALGDVDAAAERQVRQALDAMTSEWTEPATLVPHRSSQTKTVRGTSMVDGRESAVEQVDRTEAR